MSTNPTPAVSVCVPVYNGEAYLEPCLRSVLAQSFDDFEILIVDDGSTDRSLEIARAFAHADTRIRVESNAVNLGLVGNWNRCIERARGTWIKFVFQDDLLQVDCLSKMVRAGEAKAAGLVACHRTILFETGTGESLRRWHATHDAMLKSIYARTGDLDATAYCHARLAHLKFNIVGEPTAVMMRRALFDAWGAFDASFVQMCDAELFDRLGCNLGIVYLDEPLATFRVHGGSASGKNRERQFRSGVLEEIAYLHALCFKPAFENLRGVARRAGQGGLLRARLMDRVYAARDQLRWAGDLGRDRQKMQAQFDSVMAQTPRIRTSALQYLLLRIRRRLRAAPVDAAFESPTA